MFKWRNESVDTDYKTMYYELLHKYDKLKDEKVGLECELTSVKGQVQNMKLKPALSAQCKNCKYCIASRWDGDILGCCKGLVCDDFEKDDEE